VDDALLITGTAVAATWLWYNVNQLLNPPGKTLTPPPPDSQTDSDPTPQLLPKPQLPPPQKDPEPKAPPKPNPKPDNPSDCDDDDDKKTCKDKPYNLYSPLSDATGSDKPFGGFQDKSLNSAIFAMKNFRGKRFGDYSDLEPQRNPDGTIKADTVDFPQFKNPDGEAKHFNIFISRFQPEDISAGSVGKYRFCQEGKPLPTLEWRYGILNIKDQNGDRYRR
jgi:hypothetical protein